MVCNAQEYIVSHCGNFEMAYFCLVRRRAFSMNLARLGPSLTRLVVSKHNTCRPLHRSMASFERISESNSIYLPGNGVDEKRRIFDSLYNPVYAYVRNSRDMLKSHKPVFIGLSAPQGCGKTTLVEAVCHMAAMDGLNCVSMSLDDFYLTGSDQEALAARSNNPLLRFRGNAGSHDIPLLLETLHLLSSPSTEGTQSTVCIPRYNKSLREGRGDRSPRSEWSEVKSPVDIVLLEGWMLGFSSIDDHSASSLLNSDVVEVNRLLRGYESLHRLFDAWVVIAVESSQFVYKWRLEAEHRMKAGGRAGLSDEQVVDFVNRFMPAYEAYLPALYRDGPQRKTVADGVSVPVLKVRYDVLSAAGLM